MVLKRNPSSTKVEGRWRESGELSLELGLKGGPGEERQQEDGRESLPGGKQQNPDDKVGMNLPHTM